MNKRLLSAVIWAAVSVLAAINMTNSDLSIVWSLTTIVAAMNAVKQFRLYQEEKEDG